MFGAQSSGVTWGGFGSFGEIWGVLRSFREVFGVGWCRLGYCGDGSGGCQGLFARGCCI